MKFYLLPLLSAFFLFTAAQSSLATESKSSVSLTAVEDGFDRVQFEVGAAAGFPTILGIQLGVWGSRDIPFLVRVSSGVGSQVDLGVHLPVSGSRPDSRLILAASGGIIGYTFGNSSVLAETGISAGMRLGNFTFQAGPAVYFGGGMQSAHLGAQGSIALSALF
jgi:hypothetical protein